MTLEEIGGQIKSCADAMNSRYGGVVFDEWAVVSLVENKARVLFYTGPRNDEFLKNFVKDLGALRAGLLVGLLPCHFDIAAEGEHPNAPLDAVPHPREDRLAKADGERFDAHPSPSGHPIVA